MGRASISLGAMPRAATIIVAFFLAAGCGASTPSVTRKKRIHNGMALGLMQIGVTVQRGKVTERALGRAARDAVEADDGLPDFGFDDDDLVLASQVRLMQTSVKQKSNGQQAAPKKPVVLSMSAETQTDEIEEKVFKVAATQTQAKADEAEQLVHTRKKALKLAVDNDADGHHMSMSRLKTNPGTCPPDTALFWMHVPKCGTSFETSVASCKHSEKQGKFSQHHPIPDGLDLSEAVAIFREPAQRLASAFEYLRVEGTDCCNGDWGWNGTTTKSWRLTKSNVLSKLADGVDIAKNEYMQSFRGCQTNMLLGYGCMSQQSHNSSDIEEASRRIQNFRFVGIMEEWDLSICLYNRIATGRLFVTSKQLQNSRPTSTKHAADYDTEGYPVDHADDVVYATAKKRFKDDLVKFGVSKASCSFDEDGNKIDIP